MHQLCKQLFEPGRGRAVENVYCEILCALGYVFLKKFQINFDICLDHKSKPVNYRQAVFLSLLGKH